MRITSLRLPRDVSQTRPSRMFEDSPIDMIIQCTNVAPVRLLCLAAPLCQTRSKTAAKPIPVPMHIVIMPYLMLGSRCIALTSVATRMPPVAPSG